MSYSLQVEVKILSLLTVRNYDKSIHMHLLTSELDCSPR